MHEKVQTLLHAPKARIGCVLITHIENKNNVFTHFSYMFSLSFMNKENNKNSTSETWFLRNHHWQIFWKFFTKVFFLKFVLNSIFSDIHNQIFFIIPNIDSKCFTIKSKLWFFNVHVRIFPTGWLWSPTVAKNSIIFPTCRISPPQFDYPPRF